MTEHHDDSVAARARALEERLIAAGAVTDAEIDGFITGMYQGTPVNGTDPGYRELLLADGNAAGRRLGFDLVLPARPAGTGSMTADELAGLVTLNGLIGTALVLTVLS